MTGEAPHEITALLPPADQPCADCLGEAVTPTRHRLLVRLPVAFWLVAYLFAASMLGTTLPTPLYVIYQAQWHFSSGIITVIFASYAAGVLVALLLAGRSSDQVGRRPVLATALGFSAVSTVVFILAPSLGWLFVGRILSGLSAGLVTGTATAALTEAYGGSSSRRASLVARRCRNQPAAMARCRLAASSGHARKLLCQGELQDDLAMRALCRAWQL